MAKSKILFSVFLTKNTARTPKNIFQWVVWLIPSSFSTDWGWTGHQCWHRSADWQCKDGNRGLQAQVRPFLNFLIHSSTCAGVRGGHRIWSKSITAQMLDVPGWIWAIQLTCLPNNILQVKYDEKSTYITLFIILPSGYVPVTVGQWLETRLASKPMHTRAWRCALNCLLAWFPV